MQIEYDTRIEDNMRKVFYRDLVAQFPTDCYGDIAFEFFVKGVEADPNASLWDENEARYLA